MANKKYKVRKSDKVIVLAGREKGKTGTIKEVITAKDRVIIEGLNKVVCFNKQTREGMTTKEASIHISNVAHVDPKDGKATRVRFHMNGDVKQLVAKRSGKVIR